MCGICGILHDDRDRPVERTVLAAMNGTMVHRGPDDEGYFTSGPAGLAMRRLSIIDLHTGHQPMVSADGSAVAVSNGEIYNYKELKGDLAKLGYAFRTQSDTEVIPYLYQEYGDEFPTRLNGMYGLAVWDEKARRLVLARDRMGQKPLYWTHRHGAFIFASELKALLKHPMVKRDIDLAALAKYLAYEYIPTPHSIFEGVHKLGPGEMLTVHEGTVAVRPYWAVSYTHLTLPTTPYV
jgi:asparagine synthase (glutamine-hydrolysing)